MPREPTRELPPGIDEELLISELERNLEQLLDRYDAAHLDPEEAADRLAMHTAALVHRTVASLRSGSRVASGTEIVRAITALLDAGTGADIEDQAPLPGGRVLRAVLAAAPDGRDSALLRMLVVALAGQVLGEEDLPEATRLVWRHPQVLAEMRDLLPLLAQQPDRRPIPLTERADIPLLLPAQYPRQEILAALRQRTDRAMPPPWREGVYWAADQPADALAFTIDKTAGHCSPTTRYRDYAVAGISCIGRAVDHGGRLADRPPLSAARDPRIAGAALRAPDAPDAGLLVPRTCALRQPRGPTTVAVTWRLTTALPGDLDAQFAATAVA